MFVEEIKELMRQAGVSQTDIALKIGVKPGAVSQVVTGRSRSAAIEAAVALAIDRRPEDVWPQWYGLDAVEDPRALISSLDVDLMLAIQQAYWNAAAERGDDPILPLDAKHISGLYNRCAERLTRSADAAAKFAVANKEIAYLVEMDHLPRFELKSTADIIAAKPTATKFNVNTYGAGAAVTNNNVEGGTVKIDMSRKKPRG